jgi:DNA end-binding protein Ku
MIGRLWKLSRFVDADTIDRLYRDSPYVLVPQDEGSAQAYAVTQQAKLQANRIALGRVVMHTRECLVAIEPRGEGLLATTLRTRDEVVNRSAALEDLPNGNPDKQTIDIARKIIDQENPFDPDEVTDRYEDALRALIEEKKKCHKITRVEEPVDTTNVVHMMVALKKVWPPAVVVRPRKRLAAERSAGSRRAKATASVRRARAPSSCGPSSSARIRGRGEAPP